MFCASLLDLLVQKILKQRTDYWLVQGEDHICCSALSPCGGWMAYSTVSSVRLYRLQYNNNNIGITKVSSADPAAHSHSPVCQLSNISTTVLYREMVMCLCRAWDKCDCVCWWWLTVSLSSLCPLFSSLQVSRLPKDLCSVHQLCFSSDSSKLFASSSHSSVIVVALNQQECTYLHTLKPKSSESDPRLLTAHGGSSSKNGVHLK